MSDAQQVLMANAAFYRAFEALDLAAMEACWLRGPHIRCAHPGRRALHGWGPIMGSWADIFDNTIAMTFELLDVDVTVSGDCAWVVLIERISSDTHDGRVTSDVQATNVFERAAGRWAMVHHHGAPVLEPDDEDGRERLH